MKQVYVSKVMKDTYVPTSVLPALRAREEAMSAMTQ